MLKTAKIRKKIKVMDPLKWFHLDWYPSCLSYALSLSLLYAFYYSFGAQICICSEAGIARKTPASKARLSRGHVVRIIVRYCLRTIVDRPKPTYLLQKAMAQAQLSATPKFIRRWLIVSDDVEVIRRIVQSFNSLRVSPCYAAIVPFCVCIPQRRIGTPVPQYMYKSATSADKSRAKIEVCVNMYRVCDIIHIHITHAYHDMRATDEKKMVAGQFNICPREKFASEIDLFIRLDIDLSFSLFFSNIRHISNNIHKYILKGEFSAKNQTRLG